MPDPRYLKSSTAPVTTTPPAKTSVPPVPTTSEPPPPPPYAAGTCAVHVRQTLGDKDRGEADDYLDAQIFDNGGGKIGSDDAKVDWGQALVIDSMLADPLNVTPQKSKVEKRDLLVERIVAQLPTQVRLFRDGPVEFSIKEQAWDTTSSQCKVGDWNNGLNVDDILAPQEGFPVSSVPLLTETWR